MSGRFQFYDLDYNRQCNLKVMAQRAKLICTPQNKHSNGLGNRNLLFRGDNLECINYLLKYGFESKIDLVYIDPPFLSGERYLHRINNNSNLAFEDLLKESEY
ncbi:MAG: hypothetical protein M3270_06335, partial [Thermoproteota archaeon]|nr:hypothetical protein [Thermoproteota archaeon]